MCVCVMCDVCVCVACVCVCVCVRVERERERERCACVCVCQRTIVVDHAWCGVSMSTAHEWRVVTLREARAGMPPVP